MKKNILFKLLTLSFVILIFSITGCKKEDEQKLASDSPDIEGNLIISNHSGFELALYRPAKDEIIKIIPNSTEDFLVKISNPQKIALDLRLRRVIDGVVEETDFKRWDIALSSDYEAEHRAIWFVRGDLNEIYSGTLNFNYVGGTNYQVDVILNSRNGAKIITLKPGDQYENRVGIDYANYTVHFRYWYSDPNNNQSPNEIGWIEKEEVNGNTVDIFIVLNNSHKKRTLQVPHYNSSSVVGGTIVKGVLRAINKTGKPIQIWIGSDLIEDFVTPDPQFQNISTIPANSSQNYEVPVGSYIFSAKDIQSAGTISSIDTTIVKNETIEWLIQ